MRTLTSTESRKVNKQLVALPTYHASIPLSTIFQICKNFDLDVVDEDGTPWSGVLCGDSGHALFKIACVRNVVVLDWYKMPSGNYEITCYIS